MEIINNILANNNLPIITTILLGIIVATHPCILATNITAIGYIGKDLGNKKLVFQKGLLYALGRTTAYTLLGIGLIFILKTGAEVFPITKFFSRYGQYLLPPILLIFGAIILWGHKFTFHARNVSTEKGEKLKTRGLWGAFLLGLLFAMAFCPTSAFLYFGMLIPLASSTPGGYFLPIVFAIVSAIPVVLIAWLLAFSIEKIRGFYNNIKKIEKIFRFLVGGIFIFFGIYKLIELFIH
jgi:cytochrome c biogenesis protein CcdA